MRIARDQHILVLFAFLLEDIEQVLNLLYSLHDFGTSEKLQIHEDLVIA